MKTLSSKQRDIIRDALAHGMIDQEHAAPLLSPPTRWRWYHKLAYRLSRAWSVLCGREP